MNAILFMKYTEIKMCDLEPFSKVQSQLYIFMKDHLDDNFYENFYRMTAGLTDMAKFVTGFGNSAYIQFFSFKDS